MGATQDNRFVKVSTPLGKDKLLFYRMSATEELGRLFTYELDLLSEDGEIPLDRVIGQKLTVELDLDPSKGGQRFFNGYVSRFSVTGFDGTYYTYQATVQPWLWLLTRTSDCRIFQHQTIPDIILSIFREHGFTDIKNSLTHTYVTREYCVQYRETDFNFVSRLMEQAGIYYYFSHDKDKHTLVLCDSISAHAPFSKYEKIPYYAPENSGEYGGQHIYDWFITQEAQPGTYATDDFDFEKPKANLEVKSSINRSHPFADKEIYDYPGEYIETAEGQEIADKRVEEIHAHYEQVSGESLTRGIAVGSVFNLTDHPRPEQNREYLVVSTDFEIKSDDYVSSQSDDNESFYCRFQAIDSREVFRSERTTPRPFVQGPQTAIVVGGSGEDIWTDQYGRVKLQFHWDRYGTSDQDSSCWVRVAQVWAGKNFGGIFIPRIGQEVIVDFLEGDPDRPIITGRVYNADNMPPYSLPANQTQSGIKTRSTKGGHEGTENEIRFEDKIGEEHVLIHAERDQSIEVENDESHTVGNNRTKTVEMDETITIGQNLTQTIGQNCTIDVGDTLTLTAANQIVIQAGAASIVMTADGMISITGAAATSIVDSAGVSITGSSKSEGW